MRLSNPVNPVWLGITDLTVPSVHVNELLGIDVTGEVIVTTCKSVAKTPEQFTHDADGKLTRDGWWMHTLDAENRLLKIESRAGTPRDS